MRPRFDQSFRSKFEIIIFFETSRSSKWWSAKNFIAQPKLYKSMNLLGNMIVQWSSSNGENIASKASDRSKAFNHLGDSPSKPFFEKSKMGAFRYWSHKWQFKAVFVNDFLMKKTSKSPPQPGKKWAHLMEQRWRYSLFLFARTFGTPCIRTYGLISQRIVFTDATAESCKRS